MQRKWFVLLFGSLICVPSIVICTVRRIRKAPAAIARARSEAQQKLKQMEPDAATFDSLQDQVEGIIRGLRNIRENRFARELQLELDKKVVARKNYLIKEYGKQAEKHYQELEKTDALVEQLKEHRDAQQERVDAKNAVTEQLENNIVEATADADESADTLEGAVRIAAGQGWTTQAGNAVIKYLEGLSG